MLLSFAFFIPISQPLSSGLLILTLLYSFLSPGSIKGIKYFQEGWDLWLFIALLATGMLYTLDLSNGLKVIETSLSLVALPFIFARVVYFTKSDLYKILYAFCAGLLVACIICLITAMLKYSDQGGGVFFGDELVSVLENTHTIYLIYYLNFAVTFILYLLYHDESKIHGAVMLASLMVYFLMIILTGSSTAIVGILFSLLYFVLKFIYEVKRTKSQWVVFSISVFFLMFLLAQNSLNLFGQYGIQQEDYWERFVLWESAIHAMPNWVIGVGTGDYTSVLNEYYRSHDLSSFALANYNPHNQFIETLFSVGIPGLAALLVLIGRPMYMAVKSQNIIGFLSIFPFLIYGMSEVFLGRYQGVVFFALLHQAFVSFYLQQESDLALKEARF